MNLKKIINIKNKKDLNKFKLNKSLFQENYLFHYLILLNNLKALKLYKFPIYIQNNDNLNGFHLAAKEDNIEILFYLIKNYSDYIYNRNTNNELFTNYLLVNRFNKLLIKYPNLDYNILIDDKLLKNIIINLKFYELNKFITNFKNKLKINLHNILKNYYLSTEEKINILDKFENINIKNKMGEGIIFSAFNDINLFNYLLTRNIDINYYTLIKTENPIRWAIVNDILNNKINFIKNIKFTSEICNELNRFGDNIAHTILYTRISRNSQLLNLENENFIELNILKLCDSKCWNQLNINKTTPYELLSILDFSIYSKVINKNYKINSIIFKNIKNEHWLNFYKSLNTYKKLFEDINYDNYTHCTEFQSKFKDIGIFTIYLNDNYKNLYIPQYNSYQLNNLTFINSFPFSDNLIMKEPIFPWIITFNSEHEYYIHSYLNIIINKIKRLGTKRFCMVFLSLNYDNLLHANLLIYDLKNMILERFEPYGNTSLVDDYIDDILEEELTWNTGLKYIRPKDYLPYSGFQTISDENNNKNIKPGDFGGFCLAWCLWYLETKLINPDINSKILVNKLISRLLKLNINFNEYIRNYSNKINKYRIKYLEIIDINIRQISNIYLTNSNENKLTQYLIKKYSSSKYG